MNATLLAPLIAALLFAPQDDPAATQADARGRTPAHSAYDDSPTSDELGVDLFTPRFAEPTDLIRIASQIAGAHVDVVEVSSSRTQRVSRLRFSPIGTGIAVIDEDGRREALLKMLVDLDRQIGEQATAADDAATELISAYYTPRHISVGTAHGALGGNVVTSGGPKAWNARTIEATQLQETGTLVLRGTRAAVDGALAALREIDQPRPQVRLTVLAIGTHDGSAANGAPVRLPAELVDGLGRILPGTSFELLGSATVRTTVAGTPVQLESILRDGEGLHFSATPASFDAASGQLALGRCHIEVAPSRLPDATSNRSVSVQTAVTVEVGEYVVLAGAGHAPTYVVVYAEKD